MPKSAADRLPFWGGLALCVLVSALHLADAAFFLDADTGFAARGPALARCAVWAAAALLLWWLGRGAAPCPQRRPGDAAMLTAALRAAGAALAALCVERFAAAWRLIDMLLTYFSGPLEFWQITAAVAMPGVPGLLVSGALALLAAVWLLRSGPRALAGDDPLPAAGAGLLLLPWPFWLALQRFLVDPSAVERLPATLRVLSTAALLVFTAALLRAAYVPAAPNGQGLYRAGMLCFLFGTCLELPQSLLELGRGTAQAGTVLTALAAGLLGLAGLAAAWLATGPAAAPAPEPPAPKKPAKAIYRHGPAQNGPKN